MGEYTTVRVCVGASFHDSGEDSSENSPVLPSMWTCIIVVVCSDLLVTGMIRVMYVHMWLQILL